jgi:hypothetical protein
MAKSHCVSLSGGGEMVVAYEQGFARVSVCGGSGGGSGGWHVVGRTQSQEGWMCWR